MSELAEVVPSVEPDELKELKRVSGEITKLSEELQKLRKDQRQASSRFNAKASEHSYKAQATFWGRPRFSAAQVSQAKKAMENARAELATASKRVKEVSDALQSKREEFDSLTDAIDKKNDVAAAAKVKLSALRKERKSLRKKLAEAEKTRHKLEKKLQQRREELVRLTQTRDRLLSELEERYSTLQVHACIAKGNSRKQACTEPSLARLARLAHEAVWSKKEGMVYVWFTSGSGKERRIETLETARFVEAKVDGNERLTRSDLLDGGFDLGHKKFLALRVPALPRKSERVRVKVVFEKSGQETKRFLHFLHRPVVTPYRSLLPVPYVWFPLGLGATDLGLSDKGLALRSAVANLAFGAKRHLGDEFYLGGSLILGWVLGDQEGFIQSGALGLLADINNWFYVGGGWVVDFAGADDFGDAFEQGGATLLLGVSPDVLAALPEKTP